MDALLSEIHTATARMKLSMERFLFITSGYPTEYIQRYTFLDNLVCAMKDIGVETTVICPVSFTHALVRKEKLPPQKWTRMTNKNQIIPVYSPRIVTLSTPKNIYLRRLITRFNNSQFLRAVNNVIRKNELLFSVAYGHFISPSGVTAAWIDKMYKCASCLAYGENTSYTVDELGEAHVRRLLNNIDSVIAVSSINKEYLINHRIVRPEIVQVIPNAVNRDEFYPLDKQEMRKKHGFPQDAFIVAFVGYFTQIKGSQRLSTALERLPDVHAIFIGNGEFEPTCPSILFKGNVRHDKIAELLSAADVFVLPTLAEGCCNAIIEAMACGLPVISSNLPFNDDILNDKCAIRIDTNDIDAIAEAIQTLKDNSNLRMRMRRAALEKAESLEIGQRAKRILDWIGRCVQEK